MPVCSFLWLILPSVLPWRFNPANAFIYLLVFVFDSFAFTNPEVACVQSTGPLFGAELECTGQLPLALHDLRLSDQLAASYDPQKNK
jgi:hypothetical protein